MNALRRRLASGALALTVLQLALLFTAPVSACCGGGAFRVNPDATKAEKSEVECCPPGSHPPGQCPLHKSKARTEVCRMCDAPHGPQFLLGVTGVMAAPASAQIDLAEYALPAGAPFTATARPSLPDAPPPRLL